MRTRLYTFCVVSQTVYNAIFVLQPHLIRSWHSFEASSQSDQCDLICASNMFHLHLMGYCSACTVQICDYWKVARLACWIKARFWWWYTVNCSPLLNHISRSWKDVFSGHFVSLSKTVNYLSWANVAPSINLWEYWMLNMLAKHSESLL